MAKYLGRGFRFKDLPKLIINTYKAWNADGPFRMSAVVAYYAVLSMPGLLVILINVVGAIWGPDIVQGRLTGEISSAMGADTAESVETMIRETQGAGKNIISTIIGIATILFGATGVFYQLQISLNKIWDVKTDTKGGMFSIITSRAKSFGFILGIGFLLLMSFIITAVISILNDYISTMFPDIVLYLAYIIDFILSLAIISTLFAMMFKFMPDVRIPWKTVWIGAVITALLFDLGKFLLSFYFGKSDPGSTYGAAGSVILILLWVSYSCLILFFGAAFTKVYSNTYNIPAEELTEEEKDNLE
ncbi:membrane protein [Flavobacteriaceae bacterium MAR_2010_188]|nr:membrane protein [Flavobacteriaceae bacterium MAR_2010_188]